MDSSKQPSKVSPSLSTQDEFLPPIQLAREESTLTMRSVLDTFVLPGDMSPSVSARFVTCAVNQSDKTKIRFQSPARKMLHYRHDMIDADTEMTDSQKEQFKTEISKAYINTYTGKSSLPSMVTPQENQSRTETMGQMSRILKFDPPKQQSSGLATESRTSDTASFRGTTKTLWHNMEPYETFDDILLAKAYVEDKFPQKAINKKINAKKPGSYTSYRCRLSKTVLGKCKGELFEGTGTTCVTLKILTDPTCTCSTYKGL